MIRTLGFLVLTAMAGWAQQAAQPAPQVALDRYGRFVGLTAEIDKLNFNLAELRKKYTDSHPDIRSLLERLNGLRAQLSSERDGAPADAAPSFRFNAERTVFYPERARLPDNWWRNAGFVSTLRLTPTQVKQIEETFQRSRLRLIDLNAALEKEEVTLEPLVAADSLDEGKATAQIDRVAQARAELEKSRGRMLIGIRKVLEPEQWRKLSEMGFSLAKP